MDNPTFVGGFQLEIKDDAQFANNGSLLFYIDGNGGADGHVSRLSNSGSILVRGSYDNRISLTGTGEFCKTGTFTNLNSVPSDLNGDKGNPPSMPHTRYINGDCIGTSTLPVELISFDVSKQGDYIGVKWVTASEINNSHFEILVSNNGTDWESIMVVPGMGNTYEITNYYETIQTDKNYFKLKQVDYDGTTSYSNMKFIPDGDEPIFYSTFKFIYISNLNGDNINFYNIEGQLVNSIEYDGSSVVIKKSTLNTGFYVVRIGELSKKVYIYPN
jgi:hypothetical protein